MVNERPILFSGAMVRAILEGRKTQTRRVVKPQPVGRIDPVESYGPKGLEIAFGPDNLRADGGPRWWRSPYGMIGDRLWVREAWQYFTDGTESAIYRATHANPENLRWRPSIHMPRWASRITLEITGIRVERLRDISEESAIAEGIERVVATRERFGCRAEGMLLCRDYGDGREPWRSGLESPVLSYQSLWESINGPGSWDANPWVWVVEFKRVEVGYTPVPCLACAGTGREPKRTCTICQGTGKVCPGCNGYNRPPWPDDTADDLCKVCGQFEVPF